MGQGGWSHLSRRQTILGALGASIASAASAQEAALEKALSVPIRLTSERLWTFVEFAPGEQFVAIFDTGGLVSKISEQLAFRLGLKREGTEMPIQGLGGNETGRWVVAENALIGGVNRPARWWLLTSKTLDKQGFKLVVGNDWLLYGTSELDLNEAVWRLHGKNPPDYAGYSEVKGSYRRDAKTTVLQIPATVGGFAGKFQCDTGSPTNFLLGARASAALKLWDSEQPYAPWRIGGFGPDRMITRLYRLDTAEVQGLQLQRPLVMLSDPKRSSSIIGGFDGLVGLRALRNFNMLFDDRSKALWLKPNGIDFGDDERYPMSGLWLEQRGNAIFVEEVGIGSPAAAAGISAGDMIVGTDWNRLRAQINGDAGEQVSFEFERAGKRQRAGITLSPYL